MLKLRVSSDYGTITFDNASRRPKDADLPKMNQKKKK